MNQESQVRSCKPTLKERAIEEMRAFGYIASYLFVCFAVLMFYGSTLSDGSSADTFSLGAAAIKAAILAKFILIGDALGVGEKSRAPRLAGAIVTKSVQFWLLLIVLSVVEELLVGKFHGHSLASTWAAYEQKSVVQMLAKSLVVLLILLPLIATREFSRTLGPGVLRGLLAGKTQD
ncbi:MAG: hypothetical protein WCF43_15405 [Steroidobacteraceae bacterium]